jgi:hypothetical protein
VRDFQAAAIPFMAPRALLPDALTQLERIGGRGALLVIVEIDENVAALPLP